MFIHFKCKLPDITFYVMYKIQFYLRFYFNNVGFIHFCSMQTDTLQNRGFSSCRNEYSCKKETTETLELRSHLRILVDWGGNLILFAFVIVEILLIVRYSFIANTFDKTLDL